MKRELREAEKDIAQKVADAIGRLDELVFSGNPIGKIIVVRRKKAKGDSWRIGYVSPENAGSEGEHYRIHGYGLDKHIQEEQKKRVILLKELKKGRYEDLPSPTLEELLVGIAAHEVRHRVQRHFLIDLLSPDIPQDVTNQYIQGLIRYRKIAFEVEPPKGDYRLEFDAKAIEYMIVEMWHFGERDGMRIAEMVKTGARDLRPFDEL